MKAFAFALMILVGQLNVAQAAVSSNPYAPKLKDVVVLYDVFERSYSPLLFQRLMGEHLQMKMDPTCVRINIRSVRTVLFVQCDSADRKYAVVGQIDKKVGQDREWVAYSVKWSSNVEIVETRNRHGLDYSLRVKQGR